MRNEYQVKNHCIKTCEMFFMYQCLDEAVTLRFPLLFNVRQ